MTIIAESRPRPFSIQVDELKRRHSIEAEGLRKEFPGGVVAVAGIDLYIHEGEIFGFLGPNGAGLDAPERDGGRIMIVLKSCPRCHGDMMQEDLLGEAELVCLQCGHRSYPEAQAGQPVAPSRLTKKAA